MTKFWLRHKIFLSQAGFGMVEVLISGAVIVTILTAIASGSVFALKTSSELKFRGIAMSKAKDLMEAVKRERTISGWDKFYLITGLTPGSYLYCFNTDASLQHETFSWAAGRCGNALNQPATINWEGNDYIRELTVVTAADQVEMKVIVYWQGRDKKFEISQTMNQWR